MNLNISFDQATSSLPAGFVTAVNYVVNLFNNLFTANVTINIAVGYGEVNGTALNSTNLGQSQWFFGPGYTYSQARSALQTAGDPGASTLPVSDPTSGKILDMSRAQEKAL